MSFSDQTIKEYIENLEKRVVEAKQSGNRPEAARCQKAANDLRSFLEQGHNHDSVPLPVDLKEFGFDVGEEVEEIPGSDPNSEIFDEMVGFYEAGEYSDCVNSFSRLQEDGPSHASAKQLVENAEAILSLTTAVELAEECADQADWQSALGILEEGLASIETPSDMKPDFVEAKSWVQELIDDYAKKAGESAAAGQANEGSSSDDVSSQDEPGEASSLEVQDAVESEEASSSKPEDELDDSKAEPIEVLVAREDAESSGLIDANISTLEQGKFGEDVGEVRSTDVDQLQSEQAGKIDEYMKEAQSALDNGKYLLSIEYLNRVLQLDDQHQQAKMLLFEAEVLKQQQRIDPKKWSQKIETTEDIEALNGILAELETLSTQEADNEEIQELFKKVRIKFDTKKKTQGGMTTSDAVKNYSVVTAALEEIDRAIQRGEMNWYDDRSQKTRPIYTVRDELEKNLPSLAAEVYKRQVARAEKFLPHDPHNALKYFDMARTLESLDEDLKIAVEARYVETEKNVEQWEKANGLLLVTRNLEDPFERLEKIQAALKEYKHHFQAADYHQDAVDRVSNILKGAISRAVHEADALLLQEDFNEARKTISSALKRTDVLSNIPEGLGEEITRANELQQKIAKREERRTNIREQASSIQKQIEQENYNHAKEIYLALDPDWKKDPEISALRASFQHALDNDDRIKEAQDYFNNSQWEDCIKVCKEIGEEGVIGGTVRAWRIQSEINLQKEHFQNAWSSEFYDEADRVLQTLLSMPGLDRDRRQTLEDEFAAELAAIDHLKKNDPLIAGKLASAEKAAKDEKWQAAYDSLTELLKTESTQKGNIRQKLQEIEIKLHDELISELEEALDVKEYIRAFQKAEALHKRHLFWSENERSLRQQAVLQYYRHLTADLEKDNDWESIESKWETAVEEFSSDLAIRDELRTARRKHLIYRCERSLSQLEYTRVIEDLVNSNINFRSFPELDDLYRTATVLQQADLYVQRQEYVGMAEFIRQQTLQFPRPEFQAYLRKRTRDIILDLIQEGDKHIEDGEIARALSKYAVALNLNEEDVTAQGRLQTRLPEVRSELRSLLDRAEDFSPDAEDVHEKLKEGIALNEGLKNFRSVIHLIDYDSEQFHRGVAGAVEEMDTKIADLQKAARILDRNDIKSQSWRAMLRQGIWTQLDEDLRSLATLITPRHPQYIELSGRKQRMITMRKELDDALTKMKSSFEEEEFEEAIRFAADAIKTNSQIARSDNTDPFGLLEEKAHVFHIYSRQDIVGLDAIIDLLEIQKADLDCWKLWFEKADSRITALDHAWDEVEKFWPRIDPEGFEVSHPTKVGVAAMVRCIQLHEDIISILDEEPESGPESRKGRTIQQKIQSYRIDIMKSQDEILSLKRLYEDSPYYIDFDECTYRAEDLVQQHAFAEALDLINQGLDYDSSSEFLQHLEGICHQNLNKKSGFLGGLLKSGR